MSEKKLGVYSIRDNVVGEFVFGLRLNEHEVNAIREFKMICADEGNLISANPTDYSLIKIGDFFPIDGRIESSYDVVCHGGAE